MITKLYETLSQFLDEINWENFVPLYLVRKKCLARHKMFAFVLVLQTLLGFPSILALTRFLKEKKNRLYATVQYLNNRAIVRRVKARNFKTFLRAARQLLNAESSSSKNYCRITLTIDDALLHKRGDIDGLADDNYSGEIGAVTKGIPFLGLCAVIGDGRKVLLMDYHLVDKDEPETKPALALKMLRNLIRKCRDEGAFSPQWEISFDSAYVNHEMLDFCREEGLHVCSTVKGSWRFHVELAELDFDLAPEKLSILEKLIELRNDWKSSGQEKGLQYFRLPVNHDLFGEVLILFFRQEGGKMEMAMSTDRTKKSITIFRVSKLRWKHERYHWELKYLCRGDEIHNHTREAFGSVFVLRQIALDLLNFMRRKLKETTFMVRELLEEKREEIFRWLGFQCGSQRDQVSNLVPGINFS